MRRTWLLLIVVLLGLALASFAAARKWSQSRPLVAGDPVGLVVLNDYLELTPAQREAVASITAETARTRVHLREEVLRTRDELLKVLTDPDSTSEQGLGAARRFGEAQQAMQENTVEYIFAMRQHLNPKQKAKLAATMNRGICGLVCGPGGGMGKAAGGGRGRCGLGMGLGPCGSGQGAP